MIVEKSYCPTNNDETPINKRIIGFTGGAELMREARTKFWKSKNLITKEGYPTNQNLGNNQLNPTHKKSILEDSYINHILSSRTPFRQLLTSSTQNFVNSQFRQLSISLINLRLLTTPVRRVLLNSTSISESQEIIWQLYNYKFHIVRDPTKQ